MASRRKLDSPGSACGLVCPTGETGVDRCFGAAIDLHPDDDIDLDDFYEFGSALTGP